MLQGGEIFPLKKSYNSDVIFENGVHYDVKIMRNIFS